MSKATARRDLDELAQGEKVVRFHGGAFKKRLSKSDSPILERSRANSQEKIRIGKAASSMVVEGDSIFLASGTTIHEVAKNIHNRKLVVITNSLLVMDELVDDESIELISTGGMLRRSEKSFIGNISQKSIEEIQVDKVFLGTYAISPETGLTHDFLPEIMTDRTIMSLSDNVIIVADHTKFQRMGSALLAPISRVKTIVTDSNIDPEILTQLRFLGVRTIIA